MSPVLSTQVRRFLKKLTIGAVLSTTAVLVLAYITDSAIFRYRLSKQTGLGQVTVITYDAVGEKGNKTEYIFNDPQSVTCANSLFPHQGYAPCWYLQRHKEQRTDI
jgi:hypothetical protein